MKKLLLLTLCILLLTGCAPAVYDGPTETAWVIKEQLYTYYWDTNTYDTFTTRHTFAYDSYGNQVQTRFFNDGVLTEEYRYRYDDRGNILSCVTWDITGLIPHPRTRTSYTYDKQNRPLTVTHRNLFFIKTGGGTYTYDDEAGTVTWDSTSDTHTQYLNENGRPIRFVSLNKINGTERETLWEYDALGRNTKIIDHYNGVLSTTAVLRYDDQNRLLEQTTYDPDGRIIQQFTHTYEDNTITTRYLDGSTTVKMLRPDGQIELLAQYDAAGKVISRSEYIYIQIQVPASTEE